MAIVRNAHRPKKIDLSYFGANLLKFTDGGYVPVLIALGIFFVMDTWRWGRAWVGRAYALHLKDVHMKLETIVEHKPRYLDAHASVSLVVMASRPITELSDTIPPVLSIHYRNWKRLPKHIIFLSIQQLGQPYVDDEARYQAKVFTADEHGTVVSAQACYGYMEQPNVSEALLALKTSKLVKIPQDPSHWLILLGAERFASHGKTRVERLRLGVFSRLNRPGQARHRLLRGRARHGRLGRDHQRVASALFGPPVGPFAVPRTTSAQVARPGKPARSLVLSHVRPSATRPARAVLLPPGMAIAALHDLPSVVYEPEPGAASRPLPGGYRRREPEKTALHEVVRANLEMVERLNV